MTELEKGLIKTLNDNNIPTRKMVSIVSYLRGGLIAIPKKKKTSATIGQSSIEKLKVLK